MTTTYTPAAGERVSTCSRSSWTAPRTLLFGLPGVGKSHLACALGHALVEAGRSVLFTPTYQLVQTLLAARRDLVLPKALRALDAVDAVIFDDLGYVQQNADEAEVLLTLMADRYRKKRPEGTGAPHVCDFPPRSPSCRSGTSPCPRRPR